MAWLPCPTCACGMQLVRDLCSPLNSPLPLLQPDLDCAGVPWYVLPAGPPGILGLSQTRCLDTQGVVLLQGERTEVLCSPGSGVLRATLVQSTRSQLYGGGFLVLMGFPSLGAAALNLAQGVGHWGHCSIIAVSSVLPLSPRPVQLSSPHFPQPRGRAGLMGRSTRCACLVRGQSSFSLPAVLPPVDVLPAVPNQQGTRNCFNQWGLNFQPLCAQAG